MARQSNPSRKTTVLTPADMQAHHQSLPKSRHGHSFAPNKVPPSFHTIIDPDKNPPQPWRDLPPAPGLPPYRMNLDTILDEATMATIEQSGKLVFHSVGDTSGLNTSTNIDGVTRFMECDYTLKATPAGRT